MYFVKYGNEYLHDPRTDDHILLDLTLDAEENSCGYCDFTIYSNHPMYDRIKERDSSNPVEVYDNDTLLFSGFIYEMGKEFYLSGQVKCKGELAYLSESIVRPYSTHARGYGSKAPDSVDGYFAWLIEQHNNQVDETKRFKMGINQGGRLDLNNYLFRQNDQYPNTLDELNEKLLNNDNIGGYVSVRHENGERYIDYFAEWNKTNSQVLEFGVNLTDYTQTDDSVDVATYIIPTGAKMSETDYEYNDGFSRTTDTSVVSGKTYYTLSDGYYMECTDLKKFEAGVRYYEYDEYDDESNLLLTLDGVVTSYLEAGYVIDGDKLYNSEAVKKYGWVGMTSTNSDITIKENLITDALNKLKEYISPKRTIEIKAIDMHLINPDINPIRIGEYVRVRSVPHNLDSYFLCKNIELDLNNPENSLYTLGTTYDTLTGQQNKKINELNAAITKQNETIEVESKKNAETNKQISAKVSDVSSNLTIVQNTVSEIDTKVAETKTSVDAANTTAVNAQNIAQRASNVANQAISYSTDAVVAADEARTSAKSAVSTSNNAINVATTAQNVANEASNTAIDAKVDAEYALREVDNLGAELKSVSNTMSADYVRKTDLTDTVADLQTKISQNAASIESTATALITVDETANNASELASSAQTKADEAQALADQAILDAIASQNAADEANAAAVLAQQKADEATAQADNANALANQAAEDLATAKENLNNVTSRVDATEEDILAAQAAVETAQALADKAESDAAAAQAAADTAQSNATDAKEKADAAQESADEAKTAADNAQAAADKAQADVDDLAVRVISAETKISQNSNAISLCATKTEVETKANETLASSKSYTDAQLKVTSDEVSIMVSENLTTSKSYTDTQVENMSNSLSSDIDKSLTTSKSYTDAQLKVTSDEISARVTKNENDISTVSEQIQDPSGFSWYNNQVNGISAAQTAAQNAAKTATNFMTFDSTNGLQVGNRTSGSWSGTRARIKDDGFEIVDEDNNVLASYGLNSISFEKAVVFKADGIKLDNGDALTELGKNNILWSHATGYYMNASQTINLSSNISRQLSGAIFAWSKYGTSTDWLYFFVPKAHVLNHPGASVRMSDPYMGIAKYLYVSNGTVTGVASNSTSGTMNGIAYSNSQYVLRYVIGV